LSITHHTRKRSFTGPRTTHGSQELCGPPGARNVGELFGRPEGYARALWPASTAEK
jgi:hypothetical protein